MCVVVCVRVERCPHRERQVCHVIFYAHGERVAAVRVSDVVIDRLDHCRTELLARQPVASAHNLYVGAVSVEGRYDVET